MRRAGSASRGNDRPVLLVVHSGEGIEGLKEGVIDAVVRAVGQFWRNSGGGDFEQRIELMLGRSSWWCDGWWPGWQSDCFEVGSNRSGRRQGGDQAHSAATRGALADLNGEDAGEQDGPGQSMSALLW